MLITDRTELRRFSAENRIWQGIPSIERTEKGRLFSTFYSGNIKETMGNFVVLLKSDDDGMTWSEPVAAACVGESGRCYDANLWIDPKGRLWWEWAVMPVCTVWAAVCEDPDAETLVWSLPRCIGGEVMMNKPIVTADGAWLFPMAAWRDGVRDGQMEPTFGRPCLSGVWSSRDEGASFEYLGGADVPERQFDEHMLLEKRDGSLLMLVRTFYGIGKSVSKDGGRTWSPGDDSGLPGPCSRFLIRRLASGNVLFVSHLRNPEAPFRREKLCAWLSRDDCETWEGPLMLDERSDVSYPDATERGGSIWITYDRERGGFQKRREDALACAREILFCRISEADILAGSVVDPKSRLRQIVSKLGVYRGPDVTALYEAERQ